MNETPHLDINSLPIGYAEILIKKDKINKTYSYEILLSNNNFNILFSYNPDCEKSNFRFCKGLETELFNQKKLKSYYNVIINNSYMEFEHKCPSIYKCLIIKLQALTRSSLSITIVDIPAKKHNLLSNQFISLPEKLLANSCSLVLVYDSNLILKFYNPKAKLFLGVDDNKKEFSDSLEFVHPDDKNLVLDILAKVLKSPGKEIRYDIRVLNEKGEYLIIHFLAKNMLDVDIINGIVINAIEITNQKIHEQRLIENEMYLESIFKAIPNLIFVLDYEGRFLDFKSKDVKSLAFSPDQFIGKKVSSLFPEYLSRKFYSALSTLKTNKEVDPISYQYRNRSDEAGYYECHFSILNEKKVLAIVNDVTALKKAEELLTHNQKLVQKKLDAVISPEGNLSDLDLADLVDIDELKDLFKTVQELTKIPITLLDKNGDVLFSIGLSDLCKQFNLVREFTANKCHRSNVSNAADLDIGQIKLYKCLNNVWNLVSPIYVGGQQIASLDICQFRLAEDKNNYDELFIKQANANNFNVEKYLEAYYSLPIIKKDELLKISTYYRDLLSKITSLSYAQIKQARTANQLRIREEQLVRITDNMTDMIFIYGFNLKIVYVSPSVEKIYGFTQEEYKKRTPNQRYPKDSLDKIHAAIAMKNKMLNINQEDVLLEVQEYSASGKLIDVSVHAKFLRDKNNNPIGIIGSARDISERKIVESELNKQLQLQKLLNPIAMSFINMPMEKIQESVSKSLKKFAKFANADRAFIFKYDWDNKTMTYIEEWCNEGIEPDIQKYQTIPLDSMKEWENELSAGKAIIINDVQNLPDEHRKQILTKENIKSVAFVPLMNKDECLGFIGFSSIKKIHHYTENEMTILNIFANLLVNIQNRILMASELRKEKERATESDKLKSNLLKNISHEFRTPLNGIIGLSELLQTQDIDPEFQKMANMILSSGNRLNYVLDSIMLLSQLESLTETKNIPLEQLNLSNMLQSLSKQYSAQFKQKGLDLFVNIEQNIVVKINENLFRQAIIHIINNAIKFTRKGSVKISCTQPAASQTVLLSIEDTGIGIPTKAFNIIFSDFRQVSEGYNRAYEGCGLGLPIAKRALELMQGKLILESELEQGTKVTIQLPVFTEEKNASETKESESSNTEEQIPKQDSTSEDNNRPLILIVEDNIVNQKLATSILKQLYDTDSAFDGETAITMTTQKQYDAILMDIHLGEGLDGLEVTKILRNDIRYKSIPIIAVTGYTMLGDKEHIMKQGCSHYLGKPYNKNQLLDILNKVISSLKNSRSD